MPLLLMCGLPCSGKSRRVEELMSALKEKEKGPVYVVREQERAEGLYMSSTLEKELRGSLRADVHRLIGRQALVILDWMNYTKSFRYELYCIAKEACTPHSVVWCVTNEQEAKCWNHSVLHYPDEEFNLLCRRFETPQASNRWDSPLFLIQPADKLPVDDIIASLYERKAPPPNQSTQSQPLASGNLLFEVDRVTKAVVSDVILSQGSAQPGDKLPVSGTTETVTFVRHVPPAELQRIRRAFLAYSKTRVFSDASTVPTMFVQYLNKSLATTD